MYIASDKSWSTRTASYLPAFIDSCLTVGHMHSCPAYLVDELVRGVSSPFDWTKWWFWCFIEHGVVLVLWRVGAILSNGYGIQGQNYVATYQGSDG